MTKVPKFSLEPLTFSGMPALELVGVAAAAEFDFVSLVLNAPLPFVPADTIRTDTSARAEVANAMREKGVGLLDIECFNLTADALVDDFRPALQCGHELGARSCLSIIWDNPDRADALRKFQMLCDMAAEYGLRVNMEFLALCRDMPNLETALEFVKDSRRENCGLVIDMVHLIRTGASIDTIRSLDPSWIGHVQLCDGPAFVPAEKLMEEAAAERLFPGEGQLPVRAFVDAIPHEVMGLEVPKKEALKHTQPVEIAKTLIRTAREIYVGKPAEAEISKS